MQPQTNNVYTVDTTLVFRNGKVVPKYNAFYEDVYLTSSLSLEGLALLCRDHALTHRNSFDLTATLEEFRHAFDSEGFRNGNHCDGTDTVPTTEKVLIG